MADPIPDSDIPYRDKPYRDKAYDYMEWFNDILNKKHFKLKIIPMFFNKGDNIIGYTYNIYNDQNAIVGSARAVFTHNDTYQSSLRSKKEYIADIIHIPSIKINKRFQGRGLGTKLLLAVICHIYVNTIYNYTYVTLDDDTDSNLMSMDKNIYNRLGFVPIGLVALANIKKQMIAITADNAKIQTIDHLFNAIIDIKMKGGKHSKNKRHTIRRKHKKRRTVRKT